MNIINILFLLKILKKTHTLEVRTPKLMKLKNLLRGSFHLSKFPNLLLQEY